MLCIIAGNGEPEHARFVTKSVAAAPALRSRSPRLFAHTAIVIYPAFFCRSVNDSPGQGLSCAMSRLLRSSYPSSYSPLPQTTHIDDENATGKETTRSLQDQGKRHLCSYWFQLAMSVVFLFLAGTAGFFIGLSYSLDRPTYSSFAETVPQGL